DECLENHEICLASPTGDPSLPHRVIDVGSIDGPAEPYLLETSYGQVGNYMTLSHCWGGGTPVKTTSKNIQHHRVEVKLADLPRTFRDAVQVARKLSCRYLWIDSLCIIQDDRKDWEREAALMQQYYKHSLLTIAAADGNSSEAGLFRDRNGLRNRPCELQFTDIHGSSRQLYAYTNSMAWVFQEQALPPRTLTYSRDRISWRCQEMLFDERAPLIQKLIAIQGIADAVASVVSRTYFAGIW
ncbi:HET-domain-containing protein, partial [Stipitochalara longipes BDJ]